MSDYCNLDRELGVDTWALEYDLEHKTHLIGKEIFKKKHAFNDSEFKIWLLEQAKLFLQ